ncbi:hypothetical protein [Sandaracinus amylolyticus]|uniref:hypothetical protein n=1 Tax=Sandaracinus amylolyticus TaxID=927083 RepID=UPI00069EDFBB|nr:hypothetical protein [Sandaracinus amylolyticus]
MSVLSRLEALCRLDDALVARVRRGDDLRGLATSCAITIAIGAGAYGAAFGMWRAPEMALYVALKLPLLLAAIALCTIGTSALLATVLRSKLTLRQTAICILISLAVSAALLGALAPISMLVVAIAPPPDPIASGLAIDDPRVAPSMAVARALLLFHVAVVACAGSAGVLRLRGLLTRLVDDEDAARRVLVSWLVVQLAVGAELSWLLRPFFGKPHLPPSFLRVEALHGNFVEEVGSLMVTTFGHDAPIASATLVLVALVVLAWALRGGPREVVFEVVPAGLRAAGSVIAWTSVVAVRAAYDEVHVEIRDAATLTRDTWTMRCRDRHEARALVERIERARGSIGPFRDAPASG